MMSADGSPSIRPGPRGPAVEEMAVRRTIEVLHVGSASRDVTADDPRGWRLGGGVTYAALTTARLGLRTAALIGVDEAGAVADELDLLRAAGVELVLERLAEAPIFDNRETPSRAGPGVPRAR